MKTKTIRQSVTFNTTAHEVYEAIMDARKHAAFTGSQVNMSRQVGGKKDIFSLYSEGSPFAPMEGRVMKEYAALPESICRKAEIFKDWLIWCKSLLPQKWNWKHSWGD